MTKKNENITLWYDQLLIKAQLVSYGEVKGTSCFLPNSWNIWLQIQNLYNQAVSQQNPQQKIVLAKFKKIPVFEYFVFQLQLPTLSFYSEYQKEKNHIAGFNPELFLVNQIGEKTLNDPLVLRPTSEIAFCNLWKKQSFSYTDLPVIYNQWTSVFRAEKNTRPFLRNSEFYWQETHGLFVDQTASEKAAIAFWNLYQDLIINKLCIPCFVGLKTESERFAGAKNTWTVESIMPDGQALQCATSHDLDNTFTKAFAISFQTQDNKQAQPTSFSCGISTRILGALLLTHSDDYGLVLPWAVANIQIQLYLFDKNQDKQAQHLAKKTIKLLERFNIRFRFKTVTSQLGKQLTKGEIEGIPFQFIIDNSQTINVFNRLTRQKNSYSFEQLKTQLPILVQQYHTEMYQKAQHFASNKVSEVQTLKEIEQAFKNKQAVICTIALSTQLEQQLKEKYQVTVRCILEQLTTSKNCPFTEKPAIHKVLIARAY